MRPWSKRQARPLICSARSTFSRWTCREGGRARSSGIDPSPRHAAGAARRRRAARRSARALPAPRCDARPGSPRDEPTRRAEQGTATASAGRVAPEFPGRLRRGRWVSPAESERHAGSEQFGMRRWKVGAGPMHEAVPRDRHGALARRASSRTDDALPDAAAAAAAHGTCRVGTERGPARPTPGPHRTVLPRGQSWIDLPSSVAWSWSDGCSASVRPSPFVSHAVRTSRPSTLQAKLMR